MVVVVVVVVVVLVVVVVFVVVVVVVVVAVVIVVAVVVVELEPSEVVVGVVEIEDVFKLEEDVEKVSELFFTLSLSSQAFLCAIVSSFDNSLNLTIHLIHLDRTIHTRVSE